MFSTSASAQWFDEAASGGASGNSAGSEYSNGSPHQGGASGSIDGIGGAVRRGQSPDYSWALHFSSPRTLSSAPVSGVLSDSYAWLMTPESASQPQFFGRLSNFAKLTVTDSREYYVEAFLRVMTAPHVLNLSGPVYERILIDAINSGKQVLVAALLSHDLQVLQKIWTLNNREFYLEQYEIFGTVAAADCADSFSASL